MSKGRRGRGGNRIRPNGYELLLAHRAPAIAASRACPPMSEAAREREAQLFASGGPRLTGQTAGDGAARAPSRSPATPAKALPLSGGGGALRFDARTASSSDLKEWLRLHGIDPNPGLLPESGPSTIAEQKRERRTSLSPAIVLQQHLADRKRQQREREREKQAAGTFNAMDRNTSVDQIRATLAGLGIRDPQVLDGTFRSHQGRPYVRARPPEPQGPTLTEAQLAAQRQDARLVAEARAGKPIDARGFSGEEAFKRFLIARGYASPTSWGPATRVPSRR